MSIKTLIIGVIILVIVGIIFFFPSGNKEPESTSDRPGLIVSGNAIYTSEQIPGNSISVQIVRLEKPGFVVIHEDSDSKPGNILGTSNLIESRETENLSPIIISRETQDGETIYAMLHSDNGDGKFDALNDKPVIDPVGKEPVMMVVVVSKDALEPGVVNP